MQAASLASPISLVGTTWFNANQSIPQPKRLHAPSASSDIAQRQKFYAEPRLQYQMKCLLQHPCGEQVARQNIVLVTLISRLIVSSCICLKSQSLDELGNSASNLRSALQKRSRWAKAGLRQSSCSINTITSTDSTFKARRLMISNCPSCFRCSGRTDDSDKIIDGVSTQNVPPKMSAITVRNTKFLDLSVNSPYGICALTKYDYSPIVEPDR